MSDIEVKLSKKEIEVLYDTVANIPDTVNFDVTLTLPSKRFTIPQELPNDVAELIRYITSEDYWQFDSAMDYVAEEGFRLARAYGIEVE